ncbi:MAG: FAD:protein FMN transferase [Sedimentisphaerales bacterium]
MNQSQSETYFVQSDCQSIPGLKRFCHEAMATTFEVIVVHEDARYARQAAAAAFDEVDRLEGELSRFIENSDISRINNLPVNQALRLGLDAFECLQLSCRIYAETNGAFDITIGSLLSLWRNEDGTPRMPLKEELNLARQHTGTGLLQLDEDEHTVRLLASPVQVDLGGIGKGYAVDRMAELLREWSIETVLISGGYSSVLALDAPTGTKGWPLTISNPDNRKQILARPCLQCRALSGSGLQKGRHIIDPRTAQPVKGKLAAWASASDAATADALSTAFMVMSPDEIRQYCSRHPEVSAMIMPEGEGKDAQKDKILHFGPKLESD